jgi:hypothetical protein
LKLASKIIASVRSAPLSFWLGAALAGALFLVVLLVSFNVNTQGQRKVAALNGYMFSRMLSEVGGCQAMFPKPDSGGFLFFQTQISD